MRRDSVGQRISTLMATSNSPINSSHKTSDHKILIGYQTGNGLRFVSPTRFRTHKTCHFYMLGACRFGDRCWYSHAEGSKEKRPLPDLTINEPKSDSHIRNGQYCNSSDWANAPEFIPHLLRSYAGALKSNMNFVESEESPSSELCQFFMVGECPFDQHCPNIHGDLCELCGIACLDPFDVNQRNTHKDMCEKELEEDMELSFAIQRSRDKTCGICMDVVFEKELPSERRFGILEKCNHVFCLNCIRKWRKLRSEHNVNQIDMSIRPVAIRSCPECRVSSDFVTPSRFWVDSKEDKEKIISEYKLSLHKTPCRYFKQGAGTCPFGGRCFYLHAKPDGTIVELPPPSRRRRRNQNGESVLAESLLWEFIEVRNEEIDEMPNEDIENALDFYYNLLPSI